MSQLPLTQKLTPQQKAAVIIGLLGKDDARPVLDKLPESSLRGFAHALATLGEVPSETVAATVEEFLREITRRGTSLRGDLEQALGLLKGHVSEAMLSRLRFELDQANKESVWLKIAEIDPVVLAEYLSQEHPQVAAVVLSKLSSDHAAKIINETSPQKARAMIAAISRCAALDPAVVDTIGVSVAGSFFADRPGQTFGQTPVQRLSAMLNYASGAMRDSMLAHLDQVDAGFAAEVKKLMFTFADIPARIDKKDLAKIARAVDQGLLLKALAGAAQNAPDARAAILGNISTRLAEQLNEALAELGTVRVQDADDAQSEVVRAIRALEAAGELVMIDSDEA